FLFSCQNHNNENNQTVISAEETTLLEIDQELALDNEREITTENTTEIVVENNIESKPQASSTNIQQPQTKLLEQTKPQTIKPNIEKPILKEEIEVNDNPNHQLWNELSKKYVTEKGKVNYKGFKSELTELKKYIDYLAEKPVKNDWSKNEALAYWFNLYNASTVYLIASNYPISSITNLENGKPWDKKFIQSGDKTYSLNDIENVIVRPKYKEPLVHVAFNCAAGSCPILLNEAFVPEKLYAQLNAQAKKWVNDTSKNKLDVDNIKISQIFEWYKSDFDVVGGVVGFINKYANTKVNETATISFLEYNWNLNE
ncbi:MAG: hypothetical protein CVT95_09925, partial [Bacteroidetes bacterium HGW-Bacteroidetes-12]